MAGAPIGSKNGLALKTIELKKEAYKQYCDWIALGYSKKSWFFKHPKHSVCWETMEKYIRDDPINLDPLQKKNAEALSLKVWEKKGITMMEGEIKNCQPAIYQMFMRNKFGWDRDKLDVEQAKSAFEKYFELQKNNYDAS